MRPHAKHLDDALLFEDLINKPVLDIDAAPLSGRPEASRKAEASEMDWSQG
jgi:hypothetical protein